MRKSWIDTILPNKIENEPLPNASRIFFYLALLALFGSLFLFFAVFLPNLAENGAEALFTGIVFLTSITSIFLLRSGRLNIAVILFISLIGIWATITALDDNGLRNATISIYFLLIAIASMFLGTRGVIAATTLAILSTGFIYFAELAGVITIIYSGNVTLDVWVAKVITLVGIGIILDFTRQHSLRAIQWMENNARELTARNIELEEIQSNLELTIQERTAALERRAQHLEAAAEVGSTATSIYDQDELLPQVVQLISERFNFYQVGIFLLDEQNEYAHLRAASSEGGRRMLARGHKLKVGEEGIVGFVTGTGQARIALDVGEDATHFDTPELPQTRSEMALPLFFGGRLIGAIDVQSTEAGAFSTEDISALRVLADQVSMAINNAQLFKQLQDSLESERRAFGDLTREAWRDLNRARKNWGFRYFQNQVTSTKSKWSEDMIEAAAEEKPVVFNHDQPTLAIPLSISDQVVGIVRVRKGKGHAKWTDDEIEMLESLTDRLSQTLEGARLFQATQKQAAQEQISGEIASNIRQSLNIDAVLRTAAREFGETFKAKEVVIRMKPDESQTES